MLEALKRNTDLFDYLKDVCCDAGVCLHFKSDVPEEDYVIIKVDDFYNSLNLKKTPKSPDCLIILRCQNGGYNLSIVELKGITSMRHYTSNEIIAKFKTCLNDFMNKRFKNYFNRDFNQIKLYFVTHIDIYRRDLGLSIEILMETPLNFNGVKCRIEPKMSTYRIPTCY